MLASYATSIAHEPPAIKKRKATPLDPQGDRRPWKNDRRRSRSRPRPRALSRPPETHFPRYPTLRPLLFELRNPRTGGGEEAFYYPDGMIICVPVPGDALFTDSPSVIIEVLSPTTRRIDEVQKFRDYITIPTLETYILAETESPILTLHRRDGAGFRRESLAGLDAILDLPEAGITIPLADLYRDVG